jgi:hypothetical protein
MSCGSLFSGHLSDYLYQKRAREASEGKVEPEHRLRLQFVATVLFPVGVLLYAWLGNFNLSAGGLIFGMAIS